MIAIKNEKQFDTLEKERKALFNRLEDFSEEQLHTPEKEGAWSMIQVVNHLIMAEKGTELYIRKKTQKPEAIPKTSMLTPLKVFSLSVSFALGLRFKAPKALGKVSNEESLQDLARAWSSNRHSFYKLMEELPQELQERALFRHPISGRINMTQTLDFFSFHFHHHMKQIGRIQKAIT